MNIYSFAILVFAIVSFSVGFQVWVRRKDQIGSLYFALSLLYAWWGIFCALCISAIFPYEKALFFARFHNLGALFIPICWLHFVCVYTGNKCSKKIKWLYLLPAVIGFFFNTKYFVSGLIKTSQFAYYAEAGPLFYFHAMLFAIFVPLSFYVLFADWHQAKASERNNKLIFILVSLVGYVAGGFTFLPCFGIDFPQHGLILMPLYPFCLAYFMSEKGLLNTESIAQAAHRDKLAALGILTASVNHEIRAPLFVIRGTVETETDSSKIKERVISQVDRLTGIVSRLTHFAKKGVEEEAQIEPIDFKEVLADIRPLFQHQLNYQSIEFTQDIPADLPKVMADRRYLEEILFNLILNACQALKNAKQPAIKLSASWEAEILSFPRRRESSLGPLASGHQPAIVITIADNGPGIPPDQLKNIFKPFHTTKQEGTGLGLYITKQLVEKCGGTIEAKSQQSSGAQFVVRFNSK